VPTRYAATAAEGDASLRMARKTEWLEIGLEQFRGLGQRVLTTSAAEVGLLEAREIVLHPSPGQE
jgi:type VI secretion system protein ImpE